MNLRVCKTCGHEKPIKEFPRDKKGRDGRKVHCRRCFNKRDYQVRGTVKQRGRRNQLREQNEYHFTTYDADQTVERKCMRCSNPFRTTQDYRMCPGCRSGLHGFEVTVYEGAPV